MTGSRKPDEAELRARLTDEQYRVTQEKGTERAFTGTLLHNKESGVVRLRRLRQRALRIEAPSTTGSGWRALRRRRVQHTSIVGRPGMRTAPGCR